MKRTVVWVLMAITLLVVVAVLLVINNQADLRSWLFSPTTSKVTQGITGQNRVVTITKGLAVPWEIAFLPNGDMLISERGGQLLRLSGTAQKFPIQGVEQTSEGGLLGVAVHPRFEQNKWIYVYYTTRSAGDLTNVVERYSLNNDALSDPTIILKDIPASTNHDGGRLAFGPDQKLYVTTGDAGRGDRAQDKQSLAGKILRLNDDGTIPTDNPFQNEVYSYGLRNVQGIAWDDRGQLWATDHGRSGAQSGYDELNLIKKGANYGWPVIEGDATEPGTVSPVAHSGSKDTWAPAGMTYNDGSLFFTGLRGQTLYEARINTDNSVTLTGHLRTEYGRLRAVTFHKDSIYITTSNTDGRGRPGEGDDKLLRISRTAF